MGIIFPSSLLTPSKVTVRGKDPSFALNPSTSVPKLQVWAASQEARLPFFLWPH